MAKKNFKKEDEQLQNVGEALNTASQWFEKNQNLLEWILIGVIAVVAGVVALSHYVIKPKGLEAANENAKAEAYFLQGDYTKALNGDEADCIGFEQVAADYGFYQQGKLAALYAGICYYQLGEYDQAAKFLKKFSAKDLTIDPAASQLLGDAYVELGEYNKAISAFKAAAKSGNKLIAPMSLKKAGIVYLEMDNKKAAKQAFETIKAEYPMSQEAQDIDKYIAIAQ
ncbi:MAG: tetratricopeptide repeat protein [Paludibacteraceae bacterium]|nr:tetratricopeptide repeat protein [Paludibacteraceae bacterium]